MQGTSDILVDEKHYPISIIKWFVSVGDSIKIDQTLCCYEYFSEQEPIKETLKSTFDGEISSLKPLNLLLNSKEFFSCNLGAWEKSWRNARIRFS
jgi:hypothetical protein